MSDNPSPPEDTQANINPYKIPVMIWDLMREYFESKYKVEVSTAFSQKKVDKPTIVWRIYRRTPGGGKTGVAHARGPNFTGFRTKDTDGNIHMVFAQRQKIILEYMVYGTSTDEVENIAWDLENAVLETEGSIQSKLGAFQISLMEQITDSSMSWRQQDDLVIRTMRFEIEVPIKYIKVLPELRTIQFTRLHGRVLKEAVPFVRETADREFYIPVELDQRVLNIFLITAVKNQTRKPLIERVDYDIVTNSEGVIYISWLDDYGVTPDVGESFIVDYEIAPLVTIRTLNTP